MSNKPNGQKLTCERCDGCGRLADDEDGTPWKIWTDLPPAVMRTRLVRPAVIAVTRGTECVHAYWFPITCPACKGTGTVEARLPIPDDVPDSDESRDKWSSLKAERDALRAALAAQAGEILFQTERNANNIAYHAVECRKKDMVIAALRAALKQRTTSTFREPTSASHSVRRWWTANWGQPFIQDTPEHTRHPRACDRVKNTPQKQIK